MKIKESSKSELNPDCDFWYDLTDGGYIRPEEILEDKEDVAKVLAAIAVLKEFYETYMASAEREE